MVHISVENLLSTSKNRPLFEALWFLAFAKNNRSAILENESISKICNDLIDRINSQKIDARSFLVSTNLIFGTIRLYKAQIDKLYDQARFALQSCNTTFYEINWLSNMTQMTSTPIVSAKNHKTQNQTQKSSKKKATQKNVKEQPPQIAFDDCDLIEHMYSLLDNIGDEETLMPDPKRRSKGNSRQDTGIDVTMANDVNAITLREPTSLLTSGFNTMLDNEYEDGFGDIDGEGLENLIKDTAGAVFTQIEALASASILLSAINSRKRASNSANNSEIKKRRLTYMNCEDSLSIPRNAIANQSEQNIDVYEPNFDHPTGETSTFNENLSVIEVSKQTHADSAMNETSIRNSLPIESMEVENEPSIPHVTFNEETMIDSTRNEPSKFQNDSEKKDLSRNEQTTIHNDSETVIQNNTTLVPNSIDETAFEEMPELTLEKIPEASMKRRTRKTRSLIVDKQTIITPESVKKVINAYTEKMVETSPFNDFQLRMHYFKSCTDVLFSNGSFRLRNSKLDHLYVRNMKKISQKTLKNSSRKKTETEKRKISEKSPMERDVEMENLSPDVQELRRSSRLQSVPKESTVIEQPMDQEFEILEPIQLDAPKIPKKSTVKEFDDVDTENISPNAKIMKCSTRSRKILKESNLNENPMLEDLEFFQPLPLAELINEKEALEEFELPPAIEKEVIQQNVYGDNYELNNDNRFDRKQLILGILNKFWKKNDESITMKKICAGMSRSDAAGAFFELLLLAKYRVVELVQDSDSLEITNVICKISTTQLSKELKN